MTLEVLAALRAATSERHSAVDRAMPLSRPNPTLADYIEHLLLMRSWLVQQQSWLEGSQRQTALIDADLADAGVSVGPECALAARRRPSHTSGAYGWGARYVVEGSRLGAAVLYRRLANTLHPHKLRYLRDGDRAPGDRWPQFLRELRGEVKSPAEVEAACAGACDSFDMLLALRHVSERS